MITPDDITDELIERAEAQIRANTGRGMIAMYNEKIAAILNAAIEAGLVSPPVYAMRNVFTGKLDILNGRPILFNGDHYGEHYEQSEHWKGQTE